MNPVDTLSEYIKHASVSTDPSYADGMVGARNFVTEKLESIGFEIQLVETDLHPVILASYGKKGDNIPHVLIYAHYDVQPADPFELWDQDPFHPVVKNNRLYGRGASDNKGPFIAQLFGVKQFIEKNPDAPIRISFLIEGEEEMGSPSFPKFLQSYKDWLSEADFILITDTITQSQSQPIITTSLRGLVDLEVHVTGPKLDVHSGLYGGAVMNPIRALTKICASLHNEDGLVNIPGFYDDVQPAADWERQEVLKENEDMEVLKDFLGIPAFSSPKPFSPQEAPKFSPTLEFNGIWGGYQGEGSKTIIPSAAHAKITCRLVGNQDPLKIKRLVTQAIQDRCPDGVTLSVIERDGGEPYLVTPPGRDNSPNPYPEMLRRGFKAVDEAATEVFGNKPLYLRLGGSIPIIGQIKTITGLDSIMIGLSQHEDKVHSPNESFDLALLERGIDTYERLLSILTASAAELKQ